MEVPTKKAKSQNTAGSKSHMGEAIQRCLLCGVTRKGSPHPWLPLPLLFQPRHRLAEETPWGRKSPYLQHMGRAPRSTSRVTPSQSNQRSRNARPRMKQSMSKEQTSHSNGPISMTKERSLPWPQYQRSTEDMHMSSLKKHQNNFHHKGQKT
jgi:hypothetical protein